jgi:hypothetical protein
VIPRVITTEFYKRPQRPAFVSPFDPPIESRLDPSQTLMSFNTIKKVTEKGERALAIGKVASRDEQLILKAGEALRDVTSQIAAVYNPNKEVVMSQNYGMIMNFSAYNPRTLHGSIYRKESSPDYYDTKKISKGFSLLS